jgi:hypothetical protein
MPAKKKPTRKKRGPAPRRKPSSATKTVGSLNFTALVDSIRQVHKQSAALVNRTVNTTLTVRNWVIGAYLREYEQRGADRARYGDALVDRVAERLGAAGLNDLTARYLRLCRQFAAVYPEVWRSVTAKSAQALLPNSIWRSLTAESSTVLNEPIQKSAISESERPILPVSIFRSLTGKFLVARETAIRETATPKLGKHPDVPKVKTVPPQFGAPIEKLLSNLSFTHLEQLISIEDPLKRAFYEIECIRGNWSVRALKRQIATLYFERSGLSKDKEKLAAMVKKGVETAEPKLAIRDPYITYVTWYRKHMMADGDNPPVGLLLCTGKDHALVQYAIAGMDNRLFVSKYAMELPSREELGKFLHARHLEMLGDV